MGSNNEYEHQQSWNTKLDCIIIDGKTYYVDSNDLQLVIDNLIKSINEN